MKTIRLPVSYGTFKFALIAEEMSQELKQNLYSDLQYILSHAYLRLRGLTNGLDAYVMIATK